MKMCKKCTLELQVASGVFMSFGEVVPELMMMR